MSVLMVPNNDIDEEKKISCSLRELYDIFFDICKENSKNNPSDVISLQLSKRTIKGYLDKAFYETKIKELGKTRISNFDIFFLDWVFLGANTVHKDVINSVGLSYSVDQNQLLKENSLYFYPDCSPKEIVYRVKEYEKEAEERSKNLLSTESSAETAQDSVSMQPSQTKLMTTVDYHAILAKYDVAAINKSAIKYSDAVLSVADELLNVLQEYEAAQASTIANSLQITLRLSKKYTNNPNLTAEENKLLSERQKLLLERLDLGLDKPKRRILSAKEQGEALSARIEEINDSDDMFRELGKLEAEPRADFELLVENLARIILNAQRKVDFFTEHKDFVSIVVKAQTAWSDNYKAFKTNLREELAADCRDDSIDDEVFAAWYDDWQKKRLAIEQRFMPLVEFALKGNLLDATVVVLDTLQGYRDAVDKFYLHERKNIYQKFAFVPGGDLQEKFETESELYKLAEKLQRDLQGIIFACDKTEERIFLLRWLEPILNLPIDEISNFIRDKELDTIAEEVLTQFAELRRKNFAEYLADSKAYSEAAQKREKEFNALIFRMRKDLRR